jgi:mannose-6-phosphate isomerase-like protein (cupin superfamily)
MHGVVDGKVRDVELLAGRSLGTPEGDFVIVEWKAEVGAHWIAPLHVHHGDDEAWYVLEGTLGFRLGDEEFEARTGSGVFAPRGTPHTFRNGGDREARYLLVMTPKIARLIDAIHEPGADIPALFASHDSEILTSG